jgi:hypothetical protein
MNRLVVNPNGPDSWEIQLKEGANHLGRGDATDFQIPDPSVSTSHCQIHVSGGDVSIQDLGSTNGTFINGAPTTEAKLQHGQTIRLGNIEILFHGATRPPEAIAPAVAAAPAPPPAPAGGVRLRVSGISHAPAAPEAAAPVAAEIPPPLPTFDLSAAPKYCKFHPKTRSRWFCAKCIRSYCDLCVNANTVGGASHKNCRKCGSKCAPMEVEIVAPTERGFITSLPGAFVYPFRGTGILILIFSTILFAAMSVISAGFFAILMKMAVLGYLFSYMQNIIHATANEEEQMPELPGMDDLFSSFFRLAGTVVMSFGLTIGVLVAKYYEVEIPISAIIITILLGCLYFPMAFLVVAMKDNVMACNPLVVVPSILRVPGQYIITVVIFSSIFGVQQIGNMISSSAGSTALTTTSMSTMFAAFGFKMIWSLLSVYLLTVNMRIMGLLYLTQKEKLGWY